jgi:uncharacterized protein
VIAVVYFVVVFFGALPDHLILFPSTNRIDPHGAVRKTIPFENGEIELWTARSKLTQKSGSPEIYVLRFYGNADRAERWVAAEADSWNERSIEIWGMNYPGFGGSTGPAKLKRVGPAAMTAFEALQREANGKPIVIFAASLGTTVALHVAANRPLAGLVLHNPPAIRQMILQRFGWWNLWLLAGPAAAQVPNDLDSLSNAKKIDKPAVFLLAENDEVVPPRYQRMVVDAYAGEKRVITLRGAHHNSPIDSAGLADLDKALDWLLPRSDNR